MFRVLYSPAVCPELSILRQTKRFLRLLSIAVKTAKSLPQSVPLRQFSVISESLTAKRQPVFREKELKGADYTGTHTVTDGNIITAKGAGCAIEFGHAIVSLAVSKDAADKVIGDMQCL